MPRDSTLASLNGSWLSMAYRLLLPCSAILKIATCLLPTRAHTPRFGSRSLALHTVTHWSSTFAFMGTSSECDQLNAFFFLRGRTDLAALLHKHHVGILLVAVDEMAETLELFRIFHSGFPLALVGVHQVLHLCFQFRADAERIVDDHVLQVFQAAFQVEIGRASWR